ncbi:hypothetical protein FACS1894200_10420 [Spirochaetia bacterium]|nr:hypothetical protein FACS1894200_10420 [Spirochaetia bacterium]
MNKNTLSLIIDGMSSIGQLFPTIRHPPKTNPTSVWQGVGDAFAEAGDNIRDAINEVRKSQEISDNRG